MRMKLLEATALVATLGISACSTSNGTPHADVPRCVPSCNGTCVSAGCLTTLAQRQNQPSSLTVTGTSVYWTNLAGCAADGSACSGTVAKVSLDGSGAMSLATGQSLPSAIVASDAGVYWVDDNASGTVKTCALAGCPIAPISLATGQDNPDSIAVDDHNVYWTNAGTGGSEGTGTVMKAPLGGGKATTLASGQNFPASIVVQGEFVYWANRGIGSSAGSGGTIVKCTLPDCDGSDGGDGGAAVTLLASNQNAASLAVEGESLYWTNAGPPSFSGTVMKCALPDCAPNGGKALTTLAAEQSLPYGIAVDDTYVYWVTEGGNVMRCKLGGCPIVDGKVPPLVTGQNVSAGIAVHDKSIYWTNFADPGSVMKLTPNE